MPKSYKIAGQTAPLANTDTTLYTVPAGAQFVGSTLSVCNRSVADATAAFRLAVVPSGEALAAEHYIQYDEYIDARQSQRFSMGITLSPGDIVVVRADSADLSFTLFGAEITV